MRLTRHPGHVLLDELLERDWSGSELARLMGCPRDLVRDLLLGYEDVTPQLAEQISVATGVDRQTWLNLQEAYDKSEMAMSNGASSNPNVIPVSL